MPVASNEIQCNILLFLIQPTTNLKFPNIFVEGGGIYKSKSASQELKFMFYVSKGIHRVCGFFLLPPQYSHNGKPTPLFVAFIWHFLLHSVL